MALKDWVKTINPDIWVTDTFKKGNKIILVRKQYYTSNAFYWDVYLNMNKIGNPFKTKKLALAYVKEYMKKN